MKQNSLIFLLLLTSLSLFGQEEQSPSLLVTDTTWSKEIFHFPINFAQEIKYEGIEDARFPKGWSKKDSSTFWSYVFAWHINLNTEPTEKDLENNLQLYFNGLMNKPTTLAVFLKTGDAQGIATYKGKVSTFENFFTKEPITLNVLVEKHYCAQKKKSIIVFRFSPKEFSDDVWLKLKAVKLNGDVCDF